MKKEENQHQKQELMVKDKDQEEILEQYLRNTPSGPARMADIEGQIRATTIEDVAATKIANEVASTDTVPEVDVTSVVSEIASTVKAAESEPVVEVITSEDTTSTEITLSEMKLDNNITPTENELKDDLPEEVIPPIM